MLRMIKNSDAKQAKRYYLSKAEYYAGGKQELPGRWGGKGANRLGLEGDVAQLDFNALCMNRDPATGERLTLRDKSGRTVGYDLNFHVPKSVSILYGLTGDPDLLDAFRWALRATMEEIEANAKTRVRKGGRSHDRLTGNLTYSEHVHLTARPVDGISDPHLHAHCFVFNVTWDDQEQRWKAGQFRDIKRDAPYFQAVFHARLAGRLAALGCPIERTATGWEIAGITASMIRKFSNRTEQIERLATASSRSVPPASLKSGWSPKP
jgi:conjugative relaxase-like TrwC/TraI family protein